MSAFDEVEPWDPEQSEYLPEGEWVCTISEAADDTSTNGYPQVRVTVGNAVGSLTDWITITPATISKIAQLADAVGMKRPQDGEYDPETFRIGQAWIEQLLGKQVGVIAKKEPAYNDPSKSYVNVWKYVPVSDVSAAAQSDVTSAEDIAGARDSVAGDKKVPF